jgi:hypothetical protein
MKKYAFTDAPRRAKIRPVTFIMLLSMMMTLGSIHGVFASSGPNLSAVKTLNYAELYTTKDIATDVHSERNLCDIYPGVCQFVIPLDSLDSICAKYPEVCQRETPLRELLKRIHPGCLSCPPDEFKDWLIARINHRYVLSDFIKKTDSGQINVAILYPSVEFFNLVDMMENFGFEIFADDFIVISTKNFVMGPEPVPWLQYQAENILLHVFAFRDQQRVLFMIELE